MEHHIQGSMHNTNKHFLTFPYFSLLFLTFSILWKDRKRKEKEQPQKKKEQPQEEKNRKRTEKKKTGAPERGSLEPALARTSGYDLGSGGHARDIGV